MTEPEQDQRPYGTGQNGRCPAAAGQPTITSMAADVARSMIDGGHHSLPVLDRDGRVDGVVGRGDLLRARTPRPERT